MKHLFTHFVLFISFSFFFQTSIKAQADYTFKNPVLISGSDLQTGAVYKFSNVKENLDARIIITGNTGGVSLRSIDESNMGFTEAFQPAINVAPDSNGYIEFKIEFINTQNGNLQQQDLIPVTCLDVDGVTYNDGKLHYEDQVQFIPGYFDYNITGGNLKVTNSANWIIIKNTTGISYTGIDTLAQDVMATVVNSKVSGFLIRVGAVNTSLTHSAIRYGNVYFKKFTYSKPRTLPNRTMLSLSGKMKNGGVELKGIISSSHSYERLVIEKAAASGVFEYVNEIDISGTTYSGYSFTYLDFRSISGVNYYRIHLLSNKYNLEEISNTLMVKNENSQKELEVINTVVQAGNPMLTIGSLKMTEADLQIFDMSGKIVKKISTRLNSGYNNIILPGFNSEKGYFILLICTGNYILSKKILVL
jgi:hypothetical protein